LFKYLNLNGFNLFFKTVITEVTEDGTESVNCYKET